MRVGIVLQARMGSTRLPGKTMRPILGRPMIYYVIERLKRMKSADMMILAAPDKEEDALLGEVAEAAGVEFFAGSEEDVLDRYYRAAVHFDLDHIYRATGDNPLVEGEVQDELVGYHLAGGYEYSENFLGLPHGLGGEVFSRAGLERCWALSDQPHQREGVNDYILEHRAEFRVGRPPGNPYAGAAMDLEWTVDTPEQFAWIESIYEALHGSGRPVAVADALGLVPAGAEA